ncbi:BlaI/MecI/CopY family transcriptional regulator [Hyphococcus luteus]|uniref:CopY family transcriptional repressor n=1 Tax=Hyphococcus luteus TaxID=2058213 RepID=A0A2S7JYZ1_9PROT|nr:BlaI/MecI/CopY family transcriptional regulator [Marinicaulis flavus]PQA85475.1 CopY family transcriptional repressor [Marinicaulis flavus]
MSGQITKAEFEIMHVLWDESPMAAADIADKLAEDTGWSLKTVKTLISRLVEKGAVAHEPDGRRYLYRPNVSRQSYARGATKKLADQLFGGRAAPLVAHLAEGEGLCEDDIQDLEALVKELKRDSD